MAKSAAFEIIEWVAMGFVLILLVPKLLALLQTSFGTPTPIVQPVIQTPVVTPVLAPIGPSERAITSSPLITGGGADPFRQLGY